MTQRHPAPLLAVCALHGALAWALLLPASGRPSVGLMHRLQDAPRLVPVTLIAPAGLASTVRVTPEPVATRALQPASGTPRWHLAALLAAPALALASRSATDTAPQPLDTWEVERSASVAARPSTAETVAVTAPAAAPQQAPARSDPTPAQPASVAIAHADRRLCPPAPHPAALRERGIEGAVVLRVKVDMQGRPAEVQVLSGSGWRLFDEAALQQARACRFIPATQGGQAIDSWVEFPVHFALVG